MPDMDVLDPVAVDVKIARREYAQRALGLRGTGKFLDVLATTVANTGNFDLFQQIGDVDVDDPSSIDVDKLLPILLQIVRAIPDALPKLLAIILRAPDDEEFLAEEATPGDAMRVIKTFITQNDIPQLVKDFMEVAALFSKTVAETTGPPDAEETTETPSAEESAS